MDDTLMQISRLVDPFAKEFDKLNELARPKRLDELERQALGANFVSQSPWGQSVTQLLDQVEDPYSVKRTFSEMEERALAGAVLPDTTAQALRPMTEANQLAASFDPLLPGSEALSVTAQLGLPEMLESWSQRDIERSPTDWVRELTSDSNLQTMVDSLLAANSPFWRGDWDYHSREAAKLLQTGADPAGELLERAAVGLDEAPSADASDEATAGPADAPQPGVLKEHLEAMRIVSEAEMVFRHHLHQVGWKNLTRAPGVARALQSAAKDPSKSWPDAGREVDALGWGHLLAMYGRNWPALQGQAFFLASWEVFVRLATFLKVMRHWAMHLQPSVRESDMRVLRAIGKVIVEDCDAGPALRRLDMLEAAGEKRFEVPSKYKAPSD